MADREAILARLLALAAGVTGIRKAERNVLDVKALTRPAIVIQDGSEQVIVRPSSRRLTVQIMEASPAILILVAAAAPDRGPLANSYRSRFLKAVFDDATLSDLVGGANGELRYEGCTFENPEVESREGRMDLNLVIQYPFAASDL